MQEADITKNPQCVIDDAHGKLRKKVPFQL
jgi:hypothetical protein